MQGPAQRAAYHGTKHAVLGIMTSKTGALESKDQLKSRIDEAAKALVTPEPR